MCRGRKGDVSPSHLYAGSHIVLHEPRNFFGRQEGQAQTSQCRINTFLVVLSFFSRQVVERPWQGVKGPAFPSQPCHRRHGPYTQSSWLSFIDRWMPIVADWGLEVNLVRIHNIDNSDNNWYSQYLKFSVSPFFYFF